MAKTKDHKPEKKHEYDKKENGKNATGAPCKYDPKYCDEIIKFFNVEPTRIEMVEKITKDGTVIKLPVKIANDLPLFGKFAVSINVCRDTLDEWCTQYKEFSDAYKKAKMYQENIIVQNGLHGYYEQPFSIFTMKNVTDWKDKTEQDLNVKTFEHYSKEKEEFKK